MAQGAIGFAPWLLGIIYLDRILGWWQLWKGRAFYCVAHGRQSEKIPEDPVQPSKAQPQRPTFCYLRSMSQPEFPEPPKIVPPIGTKCSSINLLDTFHIQSIALGLCMSLAIIAKPSRLTVCLNQQKLWSTLEVLGALSGASPTPWWVLSLLNVNT